MVTKTAEADLLGVGTHFLRDLLEVRGAVGGLGGVHLVGHDQLLHAQGEGQQPMLEGLPLLGDARLELAQAAGHDEHCAVSLQDTDITGSRG